jgi:hypothetical protein
VKETFSTVSACRTNRSSWASRFHIPERCFSRSWKCERG